MHIESVADSNVSGDSLMQSIRCCGGPVTFLAGTCMAFGLLFLALGVGVGWIFIVAAGSAMVMFGLQAAIGRTGGELRQH
jgi:hypothetical protein